MSALGPQFKQTEFPGIGDFNSPLVKYDNKNRAEYHLNRDKPAVELASRGSDAVDLATPTAHGIERQNHTLDPSSNYYGMANKEPHPGVRENYSHGGRGQSVMGLPRDGMEIPQTLDRHGNVLDHNVAPSDYGNYGPQMSQRHEDIWAQHATTSMLPSTAILHTAQPAHSTGDHSYISGPLNRDEPAAHVLVHHGIPKLVDGHHTTAEWRGRGHSEFPARILNLDQLGDHVHKLFDHANAHDNPDFLDHLTPFNQRHS